MWCQFDTDNWRQSWVRELDGRVFWSSFWIAICYYLILIRLFLLSIYHFIIALLVAILCNLFWSPIQFSTSFVVCSLQTPFAFDNRHSYSIQTRSPVNMFLNKIPKSLTTKANSVPCLFYHKNVSVKIDHIILSFDAFFSHHNRLNSKFVVGSQFFFWNHLSGQIQMADPLYKVLSI